MGLQFTHYLLTILLLTITSWYIENKDFCQFRDSVSSRIKKEVLRVLKQKILQDKTNNTIILSLNAPLQYYWHFDFSICSVHNLCLVCVCPPHSIAHLTNVYNWSGSTEISTRPKAMFPLSTQMTHINTQWCTTGVCRPLTRNLEIIQPPKTICFFSTYLVTIH